jgi:hypothetical protein
MMVDNLKPSMPDQIQAHNHNPRGGKIEMVQPDEHRISAQFMRMSTKKQSSTWLVCQISLSIFRLRANVKLD